MAVNKVVYGNDTLIDLTGDTVTPETMLNGTLAHDASGTPITGNYAPVLEPLTVKSNAMMDMTYTPISGVDGFSEVTVKKMNIDEQERIVRPSTSMQRITPGSGYDGFSSVVVLGATLQDKTVTPTTYQQTVTKDFSSSHYGLGTVTVEAIPSTDITPSNSSPAPITSGDLYSAQGNGYAIESYDEVTPSSTPESVSSGDIVKIGGSGVIVDAIPTPTDITPSNSSPVALTANTPVNPTASGYAISSYSSKTPSDTSPASVSSGAIIKASSSGYLYKNLQMVSTTLWTNSNPTASVGAQQITVSNLSSYKYVRFTWRVSTSNATTYQVLVPVEDMMDFSGASHGRIVLAATDSNNNIYGRSCAYNTASSYIAIGACYRFNNKDDNNALAIPLRLEGVK